MAVKASGSPLSFSEIETEFGQNSDRDLGEYRVSQTVGGLSNQPLDTSIPQSGAIKFSDFYSKRLNVVIDYHSGSTENRPDDARTKYQAGSTSGNRTVIGGFKDRISGDSSGSKVRIHVNKTIGSAVGNVNNCAVRTGSFETGTIVTVEVGSSGAIVGAGGNGGDGGSGDGGGSGSGQRNGANGGNGSSALGIQYSGTTVINNGGSITAGGGGGGGGGYRKVEREENFGGPVRAAAGGGGGGGQGLPGGSPGSSGSGATSGTATAGGNGAQGNTASTNGDTFVYGGGGGGGAFNGTGGEGGGGNSNDGGNGSSSKGGDGAQGQHAGSIEGENNVQGSGGTGGSNGAAIRRTSGITVNIPSLTGITGATDATGVS